MADRLNINRRDFLNGVALSLAAGTSLSPLEALARSKHDTPPYYPPLLSGLRGNHAGSFEIAHSIALSGAKFGYLAERYEPVYDLIVVGGGISGLAAAHFYRQREGTDKRVLVLDNHDDFGGHAKRNEFNVDGAHLIGHGGSQSLESPGRYSKTSRALLNDLGIDTQRFYEYFDQTYFTDRESYPAIHFSRSEYGQDKTLLNIFGDESGPASAATVDAAIDEYPISDESKAALRRLLRERKDYLSGMSLEDKRKLMASISYSDYLREYVGMTDEVVCLIRDMQLDYMAIGWDGASALEAWRLGHYATGELGNLEEETSSYVEDEPYIFHFPDGNASVARALVRKLLPEALPGTTMEDLVDARVDYSVLDNSGSTVRVRLNSTAIDVRHTADQAFVDVTYVRNGKPERARAAHVILACYNNVLPHICPELPEEQKTAIQYAEKVPLSYINIAVRNWQAFANLDTHRVYVPRSPLMYTFGLDFPVSMGGYRFATTPEQPTVLHGAFVPTSPDRGLTQRQQSEAGRLRMLGMSFDDYEALIVAQLDGALSPGGFDAERDIAAITVNRWPHGYSYEYNELSDPEEYGREHGPHVRGRQRLGRISIANSDASAYAYVDGAIDAAHRAVAEQISL